ncbi:MAG: glutathione S-transferase N-terminal domain-containing protein, partial [Pseudomonadota bacterium]
MALDFYYWPTPNGWKVAILLEELGIDYTLKPLNLPAGEQNDPGFLKLGPNGKMPVIVDDPDGPDPVPVFESGAIMLYLAEKAGQFLPTDAFGRKEVLEWLFWQVGNQGPMAGQHAHFRNYAPEGERDGYAASRYRGEYLRCMG